METIEIGNATVSVEHEGSTYTPWDGERQQYKYVIRTEAWEYVGNDIHSGVSAEPDEREAMGALLSFLGACWNLFPDHVREWCLDHSDEISIASLEFDPEV